MCGIAGIFSYAESAPSVDVEALHRIHNQLKRRGPDGQGQWLSPNARTALCHRRLAIIDLSDDAAQPMLSPDRKLAISFNGEIYNYRELRRRLEAKGFQFRSQSDTEVLLHLYRDRGAAMLEDLSGMFAFAIWDERRQGLLLARDPYGIKPLYYSDNGKTLRFASQVKALLAGGEIDITPDAAGRVGFYLFGSVPEPYTIYRGVRSVEAGNSIWIDSGGRDQSQQYFSIARIWAEARDSSPSPAQDLTQQVRDALLDTVSRHLVSDVPVGCFLSAGIDSAALLGLMSEQSEHPVQSITLSFSEFAASSDDEAPIAQRTAQYYGAQHTTRRITQEEFQEDLPSIIEAMDQPSIDGINTWFVSKAAAESGLKVAVSGLGGDELFAGYPGFRDVPRWTSLMAPLAWVPGLGRIARRCAQGIPGLHPKAPGMLEYGASIAGAYFLKRGLFMPWELDPLIDSDLLRSGLQELHPVEHIQAHLTEASTSNYARVASLESNLYLRNQLLRDADWAGMAHGLEIRTPLVDSILLQRLVPLLLQIQPDKAKHLLATTPTQSLPQELMSRAKTGFQTPLSTWIKNCPRELLPGSPVDAMKNQNWHWSRHWALQIGNAF